MHMLPNTLGSTFVRTYQKEVSVKLKLWYLSHLNSG